jgi:hypothetical protein
MMANIFVPSSTCAGKQQEHRIFRSGCRHVGAHHAQPVGHRVEVDAGADARLERLRHLLFIVA